MSVLLSWPRGGKSCWDYLYARLIALLSLRLHVRLSVRRRRASIFRKPLFVFLCLQRMCLYRSTSCPLYVFIVFFRKTRFDCLLNLYVYTTVCIYVHQRVRVCVLVYVRCRSGIYVYDPCYLYGHFRFHFYVDGRFDV